LSVPASILALALIVASAYAACDNRAARSLEISPKTMTFEQSGATATLTATITGGSAAMSETRPAIIWQSSDQGAATVGPDGIVTAQESGDATITAFGGGLAGSAQVSVRIQAGDPARIVITPTELQLQEGDKRFVYAKVVDVAGNTIPGKQIEWLSTNCSVAEVAWGRVTTWRYGEAVLVARWGEMFDTVPVVVEKSREREYEERQAARSGQEKNLMKPPRGVVRPYMSTLQGIFDRTRVQDYIRTHTAGISKCYEQQLKADRELQGFVEVKFSVDPNGSVTSCTATRDLLTTDTDKKKAIRECVCGSIEKLHLPWPRKRPAVLSYSFTFTPEPANEPLGRGVIECNESNQR